MELMQVTKKVINVANGENDNDAVNVSQLNKVKNDVANNTKNIATNTQNIANNTKAINTLNKKVHDVDRKSRAGIAGVAAIASAPSARKDGKSMVSTGRSSSTAVKARLQLKRLVTLITVIGQPT